MGQLNCLRPFCDHLEVLERWSAHNHFDFHDSYFWEIVAILLTLEGDLDFRGSYVDY